MNNIKLLKARVRVLIKRERIAVARHAPLATRLYISTLLINAREALANA